MSETNVTEIRSLEGHPLADEKARADIAALSEEKMDKQQDAKNADSVLLVGFDGNVGYAAFDDNIEIKRIVGKNIVPDEWEPFEYKNGAWNPSGTGGHKAITRLLPVMPDTTYTVSCQARVPERDFAYLYIQQYDESGKFVSQINYVANLTAHYSRQFKTNSGIYYITLFIYAGGGTGEAVVPDGFMIELGASATQYEPYDANSSMLVIKPNVIYDKMAERGYLPARMHVPSYYLSNNYLGGKCARIREMLNGCAANGDVFFFITDQHWEKNAKNSPALMKHIASQVHIPRAFSGGDVADGLNEQYANVLSEAFGGNIHHVAGNHDYTTGGMDGNEMAYVFDMGKANQIGNTFRHYYYVDNSQQKLRYIILNSFDMVDGTITTNYEDAQIAWLRDVALQVEEGWTVLVFTHALYHPNPGNTVLTPYPASAQSITDVLDAAECDVACIIQGHMHRDHIWHTTGGIPVVTVTCDKYQPWISSDGTDNEPWITAGRVKDTITEQAFDVVVLDKEARQLTFVRIGAPADNWTDGVSTGTVEERVVTY